LFLEVADFEVFLEGASLFTDDTDLAFLVERHSLLFLPPLLEAVAFLFLRDDLREATFFRARLLLEQLFFFPSLAALFF